MRKEEQWIVNLTNHVISKEGMAELLKIRDSLTPAHVKKMFGDSRIAREVKKWTPQKLGSVCVMGTGNGDNGRFTEFYQVSNFGDLFPMELSESLSGIEMLRVIAEAVICCMACDIVKQDLYRTEEEDRDKKYALK